MFPSRINGMQDIPEKRIRMPKYLESIQKLRYEGDCKKEIILMPSINKRLILKKWLETTYLENSELETYLTSSLTENFRDILV